MPAISYWFSGTALGAFLALVATITTLGYAWYNAAWNEQQAAVKAASVQSEARRLTEVREQLGIFLAEGAALLRLTRQEQSPVPSAEADEWNARVIAYLEKAFGAAFAHRFVDASGLPLGMTSVQSEPHRNLEGGLRIRTARLQQFLAELNPMQLK